MQNWSNKSLPLPPRKSQTNNTSLSYFKAIAVCCSFAGYNFRLLPTCWHPMPAMLAADEFASIKYCFECSPFGPMGILSRHHGWTDSRTCARWLALLVGGVAASVGFPSIPRPTLLPFGLAFCADTVKLHFWGTIFHLVGVTLPKSQRSSLLAVAKTIPDWPH